MFHEFDRDFTPAEIRRPPVEEVFDEAAVPAATPTPPYPGTPLRRGSTGSDVSLMQYDLNAIRAQLYPSLGLLTVDGIFGPATESTVRQYQAIKGLTIDGVIGRNTWNAIVNDFASLPNPSTDVYPGTPLSQGSTGPYVVNMQTRLNRIAQVYTAINRLTVDGNFGSNTAAATRRFQKQFGLVPDEVIGELTWNKIVEVSNSVGLGNFPMVQTVYPGVPQQQGSSGDSVRFIQSYMNLVGVASGSWSPITVDGQFGPNTKQMVQKFQAKYGLKIDGIVGSITWSKMISEFNRYITA